MAFVNSAGATASGSGVLNLAYTPAAGNLVFVGIHWDRGSTFTSLADGVNSYTQIQSEVDGGVTLAEKSRCYYFVAASGAALTIALTVSGTAFKYIGVCEFSGNTVLDASAVGTNGTGGTVTSGSLTVGSASNDLVGFAVCTGTGSASAGYTARLTTNGDLEWTKDTVGTGSQTIACTQTGTSDYTAWAASFKASGATVTPPLPTVVDTAVARASSW